jgi:D-alanine-D-alanine ligase-like ATP-grasp enzyme
MGNQVTAVIHRLAQDGTHLNTTSKGGTATYSPVDVLPKEVVEQSVRLSTLLRREITGVDMIQHAETGEFYLLEINNMPQLATGSFVENKFVQLDNYLGSI